MLEVDVRRSEYSDSLLYQRVTSFLSSRHFPEFRDLLVEVDNGYVTISGILESHYQKQVALESCRRVAGVLATNDQIKVRTTPK